MRVAMTVWGDRISPVLDSARTLLVAEIAGGQVVDRRLEFFEAGFLPQLIQLIRQHGVEVLICGAVSMELANCIETCNVEIIPFLAGDAELILETFARGQSIAVFAMPGCRCAGRCRIFRDEDACRCKSDNRQH